jgi:hypothetical protein
VHGIRLNQLLAWFVDLGQAAVPACLQAVQWLPAHKVSRGDTLAFEAGHDTYGISFKEATPPGCHQPAPAAAAAAGAAAATPSTGADLRDSHLGDTCSSPPLGTDPGAAGGPSPLLDPAWAACYAALQPLAAALSKAVAQDPLEYRRVAQAAALLAARPQEHGVDAAQAAAFCHRLMSA